MLPSLDLYKTRDSGKHMFNLKMKTLVPNLIIKNSCGSLCKFGYENVCYLWIYYTVDISLISLV